MGLDRVCLMFGNQAAMGGVAPTYSTWNPLSTGTAPSDPNYTFTNSNKTATLATNPGSADRLVRGASAKTAGYFEVRVDVGAGNVFVGVADASLAVSGAYIGSTASSCGYFSLGGAVRINGANQAGTWGAFGSTNVIGICIKASKIYFSLDNVWQGGGDPSAGTGGLDISAFVGSGLYPAASGPTLTNQFTINTGATAFAGTLPTGVTAWG